MLATIPLLGKASDVALLEIVSHHNGKRISKTDVSIGLPISLGDRRTSVVITARPSTPYRENNVINRMTFTYNRLDLRSTFLPYTFQGISLPVPVSTEQMVAYLKTFLPFIHDSSDFVPKMVYTAGETVFLLEANPISLRWTGSLSIPLTVTNDLSTLIQKHYLDGLENRSFLTLITDVIRTRILRGFNNNNFLTTIDTLFSSERLLGHWVWNNNVKVITSDTSLPGSDALLQLIRSAIALYPDNVIIESISSVDVYPIRGKVIISLVPNNGIINHKTLYFEKIDIVSLIDEPEVTVEDTTTNEIILSHVNNQLNTALTLDRVSITELDDTWNLTINPNDSMFYGSVIVKQYASTIPVPVVPVLSVAEHWDRDFSVEPEEVTTFTIYGYCVLPVDLELNDVIIDVDGVGVYTSSITPTNNEREFIFVFTLPMTDFTGTEYIAEISGRTRNSIGDISGYSTPVVVTMDITQRPVEEPLPFEVFTWYKLNDVVGGGVMHDSSGNEHHGMYQNGAFANQPLSTSGYSYKAAGTVMNAGFEFQSEDFIPPNAKQSGFLINLFVKDNPDFIYLGLCMLLSFDNDNPSKCISIGPGNIVWNPTDLGFNDQHDGLNVYSITPLMATGMNGGVNFNDITRMVTLIYRGDDKTPERDYFAMYLNGARLNIVNQNTLLREVIPHTGTVYGGSSVESGAYSNCFDMSDLISAENHWDNDEDEAAAILALYNYLKLPG